MSRWHPKTEWDKAEDAFRYIMFNAVYIHSLRRERSNDWRFLRALQLSSRPIPPEKRDEVMAWYRREHPYCNRQEGKEPKAGGRGRHHDFAPMTPPCPA